MVVAAVAELEQMLRGARSRRMLEANPHLDAEQLAQELAVTLLGGGKGSPELYDLATSLSLDPDLDLQPGLRALCRDYLRDVHERRTPLGRIRRSLVDAVTAENGAAAGLEFKDGAVRLADHDHQDERSGQLTGEQVDRGIAGWRLDPAFARVSAVSDPALRRGRSWFLDDGDGHTTIAAAVANLVRLGGGVALNELAASINTRLIRRDVADSAVAASLGSNQDDPLAIVVACEELQHLIAGLDEVDRFVLTSLDCAPEDVLADLRRDFGIERSRSWLDKRRRFLRDRAAQRRRETPHDVEDDDDCDP